MGPRRRRPRSGIARGSYSEALCGQASKIAATLRSRRVDVASREVQGFAREGCDTPGHRDHLLSVILVRHRDDRRGAAEGVAEIDPDALGLGQPHQGFRADPPLMACDGITGDVELPVCVLDRMVHVVHLRNEIRRALAGRCDGGIR